MLDTMQSAKTSNPATGRSGKPVVLIVGADKGGVGKTTVTRTLLDYLASKNVSTRAFDWSIHAARSSGSIPAPPR